ncbi:MAG: hypothetical protein ABIM30_07380 [candidate division WOR-3 bacterium]
MELSIDILAKKIREMKEIGEAITKEYGEIPSVERNIKRVLASLRLLELNICDLTQIQKE